MKKFLLLITILLASCTLPSKQVTVKDTRSTDGEVVADGKIKSAIRYHFEGHDYIMFVSGDGDSRVAGVVHDPECKCSTNLIPSLW